MSVKLDITEESLAQNSFRAIHAGDDYDMSFTASRVGVPFDLTGALIHFTVKEDSIKLDANAKLQLSSAQIAEIDITNPTQGAFVVKLVGTGAKTTANVVGEYPYDIQVKLASGKKITLVRGVIEFLEQQTRAT